MLRTLWIHRFPNNVQAILAAQQELLLEKLAEIANSIIDVSWRSRPSVAEATINSASLDILLQKFDKILTTMTETDDLGPTTSRRIFIRDAVTKTQFQVDTGADLCVFPCALLRQAREKSSYELSAANDNRR